MEPKAPLARCSECPLQECSFVPPFGPDDAKVIVVGEGPGYEETREGKPFVGPSGRLLEAGVREAGYNYEKDIYRTNVVLCRPPGNREPTEEEISCCYDRLESELQAHRAETLLPLGKVSKLALLGEDVSRGEWQYWSGKKVMPTWHPAYVLRRPSEMANLFRDIRVALKGEVAEMPIVKAIFVDSKEELDYYLDVGHLHPVWAFDIETDNVVWYDRPGAPRDAVLMMQIAWCYEFGIVISPRMLAKYGLDIEKACARHIMVAHNGAFDCTFLASHYDIHIILGFDTMLAHYVLDENAAHGLKSLAATYFNAVDYEKEHVQKYLKSRNDRYSKVPYAELGTYGVYDVVYTLRLYALFRKMLHDQDMYTMPFNSVLMEAVPLAKAITMNGFKIDRPYLEEWNQKLYDEAEILTNELQEMTQHPELNPNSTQQMAVVLWDEMNLPINKATKIYKKTPRSTCNEAVEHLAGNPVVDKLLELRHVSKMNSSYIENLLEMADIHDRCHPSVLLHGTEVGRIAMRDPAAQTIPRADDYYGRIIRSSVIAEPGKSILVCDYSQAELRVLAAESKDPFLLDVFANGRDLHSEVATAMFGPNYTKEQRVMCKMFNFAYAYGGTEYSFAKDAGLPIDVAKAFVRSYDQNMQRAKEWKLEVFQEMRSEGEVRSRMGRKRRFPLITDANLNEVRKSSVHFLVASAASDLTLLSAIQVYNTGYKVILLVHDSIILEVPTAEVEQAAAYVTDVMKQTGHFWFPEVPWKVDAEWGPRWVKTHEEIANERNEPSIDAQSS